MTEKHPGGISMTRQLLSLSGLSSGRILDMGAGDGHSVRFLRSSGFDAAGIDLIPGDDVLYGDFLNCPYEDGSFDAILSECAFYISGNSSAAIKEAARLLKKGGTLLLADVCFTDLQTHRTSLEDAGFSIKCLEDITNLWKEYYISCIWNGTAELLCPRREKGKCHYYLTICERT